MFASMFSLVSIFITAGFFLHNKNVVDFSLFVSCVFLSFVSTLLKTDNDIKKRKRKRFEQEKQEIISETEGMFINRIIKILVNIYGNESFVNRFDLDTFLYNSRKEFFLNREDCKRLEELKKNRTLIDSDYLQITRDIGRAMGGIKIWLEAMRKSDFSPTNLVNLIVGREEYLRTLDDLVEKTKS
jgi:hypothetical protein